MTDKEIIINMCKQLVNGIKFVDANCDGLSCEDCPFDEENNDYICCGSDSDRNYKEIAKEFLKNNGVDEMKMEKTFKEVIANIKEGEIWESEKKTITYFNKRIEVTDTCNNVKTMCFHDSMKYKLQKKQYTFTEAFAAYEEGKEIESLYDSETFLKEHEVIEGHDNWFDAKQIRNKWYINN